MQTVDCTVRSWCAQQSPAVIRDDRTSSTHTRVRQQHHRPAFQGSCFRISFHSNRNSSNSSSSSSSSSVAAVWLQWFRATYHFFGGSTPALLHSSVDGRCALRGVPFAGSSDTTCPESPTCVGDDDGGPVPSPASSPWGGTNSMCTRRPLDVTVLQCVLVWCFDHFLDGCRPGIAPPWCPKESLKPLPLSLPPQHSTLTTACTTSSAETSTTSCQQRPSSELLEQLDVTLHLHASCRLPQLRTSACVPRPCLPLQLVGGGARAC